MKKHTQEEWNALLMSQEEVEKKIRQLHGRQLNRGSADEVTGCGCGREAFGYMEGSFGIFTFYKKPDGTEYYNFANPPS